MSQRLPAILFALALFSLVPSQHVSARTLPLAERLAGRIVLQVQSRGEGWYIDPISRQRYYLGTAEDAYALMRTKGLGIRHTELMRYVSGRFPTRLSGRIVLDVESHGEAYYVVPGTLRGIFLGRADDAYRLMREYGLGITNADLTRIPVAPAAVHVWPIDTSPSSPTTPLTNPTPAPSSNTPSSDAPFRQIEQETFTRINQHRVSVGLPALIWNETVAEIARTHSRNMAEGRIPFGHDGFDDRFDEVGRRIRPSYVGENVASNTFLDPVETAVTGWLNSPGHKANIENRIFQQTGIGIAQSRDEEIFLTQVFIGNP